MLGLRFPKVKIRAGGNPASAAGGPSLTTPLSPMRPLQTRLPQPDEADFPEADFPGGRALPPLTCTLKSLL